MEKYLVDIPVAMVFFNRDDTLEKVFEKVRQAKPSKLFLIQDGPRENRPNDVESIEKCRKVVEAVDWECEIHKNYSEVNLGCGRRVSSGITWVFEHVDRAIILEDDCVIEPSFVEFAKELLDKYESDERVAMISALNHFENWDCGGYDYCFTMTGAIAAWATWKRVWDGFDFKLSDFEDPYIQKTLPLVYHNKKMAKQHMQHWKDIYEKGKNGENVRFWGAQYDYLKMKNKGLSIVPSHSLSCNIGVGEKATFSGGGIQFMPKKIRQWFFQKTYPMEFPLKHPPVILPDENYDTRYYKIARPNKVHRICIKVFYKVKRILMGVR